MCSKGSGWVNGFGGVVFGSLFFFFCKYAPHHKHTFHTSHVYSASSHQHARHTSYLRLSCSLCGPSSAAHRSPSSSRALSCPTHLCPPDSSWMITVVLSLPSIPQATSPTYSSCLDTFLRVKRQKLPRLRFPLVQVRRASAQQQSCLRVRDVERLVAEVWFHHTTPHPNPRHTDMCCAGPRTKIE